MAIRRMANRKLPSQSNQRKTLTSAPSTQAIKTAGRRAESAVNLQIKRLPPPVLESPLERATERESRTGIRRGGARACWRLSSFSASRSACTPEQLDRRAIEAQAFAICVPHNARFHRTASDHSRNSVKLGAGWPPGAVVEASWRPPRCGGEPPAQRPPQHLRFTTEVVTRRVAAPTASQAKTKHALHRWREGGGVNSIGAQSRKRSLARSSSPIAALVWLSFRMASHLLTPPRSAAVFLDAPATR